jgi:GT2 family glycosyltransferase
MEHSCALFKADWFDEANWLDPKLHIHGTDLYYSWQARRDGRGIYVHDGLEMHRHNNNMFELGRAPEANPAERTRLARSSMHKALSEELGPDWEKRLMKEFVEEEWL